MKVQLQRLVNSEGALNALAGQRISGNLSYTLSLVQTEAQKHLEAYHKAQDTITRKYRKPVPDDEAKMLIPAESVDAYNDEHQVLLDRVAVLQGIGRITLSVLMAEWQQAKKTDKKGKKDGAEEQPGFFLSGNEMFLLGWLLKSDDSMKVLFEEEDEDDPAGESAAKPS